ncbi:MAG: TIR domain-containing protein [Planctomycetota bacterium]
MSNTDANQGQHARFTEAPSSHAKGAVDQRPLPRVGADSAGAPLVFVSYAHADEEYKRALVTHLAPLVRQGRIRLWHDRKIEPGHDWTNEIERELASADLVVLLLSPSYLASEWCHREAMHALARHGRSAQLVPVVISHCAWQREAFAHVQAMPKDGRPIVSFRSHDEGWNQVVDGLHRVLARMRGVATTPPQTNVADLEWPPTGELPEPLRSPPPGCQQVFSPSGIPRNGCVACGHEWTPRGLDRSPKCPVCRSTRVGFVWVPLPPRPAPTQLNLGGACAVVILALFVVGGLVGFLTSNAARPAPQRRTSSHTARPVTTSARTNENRNRPVDREPTHGVADSTVIVARLEYERAPNSGNLCRLAARLWTNVAAREPDDAEASSVYREMADALRAFLLSANATAWRTLVLRMDDGLGRAEARHCREHLERHLRRRPLDYEAWYLSAFVHYFDRDWTGAAEAFAAYRDLARDEPTAEFDYFFSVTREAGH